MGSGSAMFFVFKRCLKCSRIFNIDIFSDFSLDILSDFISNDDITYISDDISDEEIISCVNIYIN